MRGVIVQHLSLSLTILLLYSSLRDHQILHDSMLNCISDLYPPPSWSRGAHVTRTWCPRGAHLPLHYTAHHVTYWQCVNNSRLFEAENVQPSHVLVRTVVIHQWSLVIEIQVNSALPVNSLLYMWTLLLQLHVVATLSLVLIITFLVVLELI